MVQRANHTLLHYEYSIAIKNRNPSDQRVLLIFGNFKGQWTEAIWKLLDENNLSVVLIPPNVTGF